MWDERYDTDEYAYGTKANDFLRSNIESMPKGSILSLAEGEGRNAVFLAQQGYEVTAVDSSMVGINKAKKLAQKQGVEIEFIHADLAEFEIGKNQWDGIISIFCPLPPALRKQIHESVQLGLNPNGIYLLEAYRPEQLQYGTGGGDSAELMQNSASLSSELKGLTFEHLLELERQVIEGVYHTGMAAVVQAIAKKESAS